MANLLNPNYSDIQSTGGDYATPVLWEADTDNNLVTATTSEIGRMAAETWTAAILIEGSTTSADYSRKLTYQAGSGPYDITTDTGPKNYVTAAAGFARNVFINEGHFVAEGVCAQTDVAGYDGIRGFLVNNGASGSVLDGCVSLITNSVAAGWGHAFTLTSSSASEIRNSIAAVYDTVIGGAVDGLVLIGPSSADSCTAYGLRNNCDVYTSPTVRNFASFDASSKDFQGSGSFSYCASSDATASGTGSLTSQTAAACFEDAASLDLRPVDGGPLDSSGTDLSSTFTTDITGATRSLWSIGAYDAPAAAAGPTATIDKNFSTTEYIPAHFQFTAWNSVPSAGHLSDCKIKWTVSGGSEHDGVYTGMDLGFVWQTAGTFTVQLDITDSAGLTGMASTTVTVATPTYDNVIYVSAAGSDSNDGLTEGAPKLTLAAAWTAAKAAHGAGEHTAVMLRRGDSFSLSATQTNPASGTGTFYWLPYGSGAKPSVTSSSGILNHVNDGTTQVSWKISGIDFTTTGSADPFNVSADDTDADDRGIDFVICDGSVYAGGTANIAIWMRPLGTVQSIAYGDYSGPAKQNNVAISGVDVSAPWRFGVYGFARWYTFSGGSILKDDPAGSEHVQRFIFLSRASIRNNLFRHSVRATTMMRLQSQDNSGTPSHSHEVTVEGNRFEVGSYVAIEATYAEVTEPSVGRLHIINNEFVPYNPTGGWSAVQVYGDDVCVIGNTARSPSIFVETRVSGVADAGNYMLVSGNSVYTPSSSAHYFCQLSEQPVSLVVKNNAFSSSPWGRFFKGNSTTGQEAWITSDRNVSLGYSEWSRDVGEAGGKTLAQWQAYVSQDANSVAADPAFADPANDDWSIGVDSPCYDAGENIAASWLTREGTERSGTWDIGAFELGGASITITPDPATATESTAGPSAITITGGSQTITPDPVTATLSTSGPGILISTEPLNNPPTPTLVTTLINAVPVYRSLADMARIAQGGVTKQTGDDIMKKTRSDILRRKGR